MPDPAGRIAFGRVVGSDNFYGPFVAIWVVDADGTDLAQLNQGNSGFPTWSPDGRRIAFTQHQPDGTWQIATMAPDGSDVRVLTTGFGADNAAYSPDGTWIAFGRAMTATTDQGFHSTVWRMDADGSNPKLLGNQQAFDVEPKVSPDGKQLLFERLSFSGANQTQALMVRTLATGAEKALASAGTAVEHAAWSPDGQSVVFDVSHDLNASVPTDQVEVIAADGSGAAKLLFASTASAAGFKPSYSPDGTHIVFGCRQPSNPSESLCVMNRDGTGLNVLVDDPAVNENMFSWGVAPAP